MDSLLPTGLRTPFYLAFEKAWAEILSEFNVMVLLVYTFEFLPEEAYYELAKQMDVLGYKGWYFAKTLDEKKALLKRAYDIHMRTGTAGAIRRAFKSVGFEAVDFQSGVTAIYDGTRTYDGSFTHGGDNWANFNVTIDLGEANGVGNFTEFEVLMELINNYKSARSKLLNFGIRQTVRESLSLSEQTTFRKILLGEVESETQV